MKIFTIALIALLAGCSSSSQNLPASDSIDCHRLAVDPANANRTRDPAITHGLFFQTDSAYEFRPCNEEAIYLVGGSFAELDELDLYFSAHSIESTKPVYIRFRGLEIDCGDWLPERYVSAVEIRELITQERSAPLNCN